MLVDLFKDVIAEVERQIIRDLDEGSERVFKMVLKAYNDYQESERDGVDYIFNINDQEDLKCCVEGGLTAKEIARVYESQANATGYFFFGQNHQTPFVLPTREAVRQHLIKWLDELLNDLVRQPYVHESYTDLYYEYIGSEI